MAKGNSSAGGGSSSCSGEQTGTEAAFLKGRDLAVHMLRGMRDGRHEANIAAEDRDGPQEVFALAYLDKLRTEPTLADGFAAVLSDYLACGAGPIPESYARLSYSDMRGQADGQATAADRRSSVLALGDDSYVLRSTSAEAHAFELVESIRDEIHALADVLLGRSQEVDCAEPETYVNRCLAIRLKLLCRLLGFVNDNPDGDEASWRDLRAQLAGDLAPIVVGARYFRHSEDGGELYFSKEAQHA